MKHFVVTNISAILVRTSRDDIPCNEKKNKNRREISEGQTAAHLHE